MTKTYPSVKFGLYALEIKQDSTPACDDLQSFSKILDLKTDNVTSRPYATYEPDFWLLDGTYKFIPTVEAAIHVGLMSLSMSDAAGDFSVPPVLTIYFGISHSTDSLTLQFSRATGDWANDIDIVYYDDFDEIIRSDNYNPNSCEFVTEQAVEGFKKIEITFNSTNKPYRYLRVQGIDYGTLIEFTRDEIKAATLVEQIDPISVQIPFNTLNLSLFSEDEQFSILDPTGDYAALQLRQPFTVFEYVDDDPVFLGMLYLDKWESKNEKQTEFDCVDAIGVLDTIPYMGGLYVEETVENIVLALFNTIAMPYELDPELYAVGLSGWIPICTCREALQQIAFAAGAYVTCSRSGIVKIYKTQLASDVEYPQYTITQADKGLGQPLALKTQVTGVELAAHQYVESVEEIELFDGILPAGRSTITFSEPVYDLNLVGDASIIESGANYVILWMPTEGSETLTGKKYLDVRKIYRVQSTSRSQQNIISITDATLVSPDNAEEIIQRVYNYYQQRYLQKTRLYASLIEPGTSCLVSTSGSANVKGIIERMESNLTGGFISQSEIIGVLE